VGGWTWLSCWLGWALRGECKNVSSASINGKARAKSADAEGQSHPSGDRAAPRISGRVSGSEKRRYSLLGNYVNKCPKLSRDSTDTLAFRRLRDFAPAKPSPCPSSRRLPCHQHDRTTIINTTFTSRRFLGTLAASDNS
jgi:hypothetical protein